MTEKEKIGFATLNDFLAHAHALEQELAQRYTDMADCMEMHNNSAVSKLFRQLEAYSKPHVGKLTEHGEGLELPKVPPWEYKWLCMKGPENCMEHVHYLMATSQALEVAIRIEQGGRCFYELVVQGSSGAQVKSLASIMLAMKDQHLALLNSWLAQAKETDQMVLEDLDPPNMPE